MPINMNDPRIRAEVVPDSIAAMGPRLRAAYGVDADAFGAKGNEYHNYGFHRSENWIYLSGDSRYGTSDYSVQGSVNHAPNKDWVCAFDFTPGVWGTTENRRRMIDITTRVHDACLRHDPRVADLFEFAGTLDGAHVVTFDGNGVFKSPFDSTHLDHVHGSIKRSRAGNDHTGLVDVVLGVDTSTDGDDDMDAFANIAVPAPGEVASVSVPGGGANACTTWFAATNDTGDVDGVAHDYGLRVYWSDGHAWRPLGPAEGGGLFKGINGVTTSYMIPDLNEYPDGVRAVSVMRAPIGAAGKVLDPKATLKSQADVAARRAAGDLGATPIPATWYFGSLSFCLERKPRA